MVCSTAFSACLNVAVKRNFAIGVTQLRNAGNPLLNLLGIVSKHRIIKATQRCI